MEFSIKIAEPANARTGCVVVGVYESRRLTPDATAIDRASRGYLSAIIKKGDITGSAGSTLLLQDVPRIGAERVMLIGLGREAEFGERQCLDAIRDAVITLSRYGIKDAALGTALRVKRRGQNWLAAQTVITASAATYRFDSMKSKQDRDRRTLSRLTLLAANQTEARDIESGVKKGRAIAEGMRLAKDLGNLPGNVCTPTYLAQTAQALARQHGLESGILDEKQMRKLGMNTLLSVSRASAEAPKFITLEYHGAARKSRPVVLVGKGVTFDTGGISLKPAPEMDEMKFDMCGAASVLGTLKAAAQLKLPINVVGLIPAVENMPGGRASKPGDIVTSMSGQTVEILNTDAEGRLILCDALTYAERYDPQAVIDIATLTGACVIALGHVASGLFANDDSLAKELLDAGQQTYDRAWHLPLWDEYQEQLKSNFADFANIGGRPAGSVTAACFLSRFTKKYQWAHIDIAGVAWKSGKEKGATGRPVPLLTEFLIQRATRE